jgi:AcrR family transcriptional regulator
MGRPREHDEQTAAALLAAAERTIEEHGIGALSLREVARDAGTTTRAVYSLFGSKDGLLGALGTHAFKLLQQGLEALPASDDPRQDLIEAALMFRRFALDHPALFSIGIQRTDPTVWPHFRSAASDALAVLHQRVQPLADAGLLGGRSIREAALQFHSLCEGIAAVEFRDTPLSPDPERFWRNAFHALITGFADAAQPKQRRATRRGRR